MDAAKENALSQRTCPVTREHVLTLAGLFALRTRVRCTKRARVEFGGLDQEDAGATASTHHRKPRLPYTPPAVLPASPYARGWDEMGAGGAGE